MFDPEDEILEEIHGSILKFRTIAVHLMRDVLPHLLLALVLRLKFGDGHLARGAWQAADDHRERLAHVAARLAAPGDALAHRGGEQRDLRAADGGRRHVANGGVVAHSHRPSPCRSQRRALNRSRSRGCITSRSSTHMMTAPSMMYGKRNTFRLSGSLELSSSSKLPRMCQSAYSW